jgi:hypothetical protein
VIANPWDAGSARVLAALGFPALATSSGAKAGVLGKRDGKMTRDESLANACMIVEATDLPVSADLEKCFGDAPSVVAETIRLVAGVGSQAARSRTPPATRTARCTTSARPRSAWPPPPRRRAPYALVWSERVDPGAGF